MITGGWYHTACLGEGCDECNEGSMRCEECNQFDAWHDVDGWRICDLCKNNRAVVTLESRQLNRRDW